MTQLLLEIVNEVIMYYKYDEEITPEIITGGNFFFFRSSIHPNHQLPELASTSAVSSYL